MRTDECRVKVKFKELIYILTEFASHQQRDEKGSCSIHQKKNVLAYLFRLVIHNEHGRGDGVVCIYNRDNVQTDQLGECAEEILSRLLVVEIWFRYQHLGTYREQKGPTSFSGEYWEIVFIHMHTTRVQFRCQREELSGGVALPEQFSRHTVKTSPRRGTSVPTGRQLLPPGDPSFQCLHACDPSATMSRASRATSTVPSSTSACRTPPRH